MAVTISRHNAVTNRLRAQRCTDMFMLYKVDFDRARWTGEMDVYGRVWLAGHWKVSNSSGHDNGEDEESFLETLVMRIRQGTVNVLSISHLHTPRSGCRQTESMHTALTIGSTNCQTSAKINSISNEMLLHLLPQTNVSHQSRYAQQTEKLEKFG